MGQGPIKYKTRKVYNRPGDSHYLTFSTLDRRPYLLDNRICRLFAGTVAREIRTHRYAMLAYALMPDHVHLLVHPLEDEYDISEFLKSIKQGVSAKARNNRWIDTYLWEAGGGYDRNVSRDRTRRFVVNYIHQNPVQAELVEEALDYRWSSANWCETGKVGAIPCIHLSDLEAF
ncbi:MAG: transposase [Armatimonadetes bacterium]|nr:transposase [Armatimonadota bacterium]